MRALSLALLSALAGCLVIADFDYELEPAPAAGGNGASSTGAGGTGGSTQGGGGAGGSCPDVLTDADNCGVCGRSCLGAECVDGLCEPIVLVPLTQPMFDIDIDEAETTLYYSCQNAKDMTVPAHLMAFDTSGSAPTMLFEDAVDTIDEVVVGGDQVYFSSFSGSAVRSVPTVGTSSSYEEVYAEPSSLAGGLAYSSDSENGGAHPSVYFHILDGAVFVDLSTNAPSTLCDNCVQLGRMMAVGENYADVYWAQGDDTPLGKVVWRPNSGSRQDIQIAKYPSGLALDSGRVYWLDETGSVWSNLRGDLNEPTSDPGDPTQVYKGVDGSTAARWSRTAVRDEDAYLYIAVAGNVIRVRKEPGLESPLTIYDGGLAVDVVVDDQWAYIITANLTDQTPSGELLKIAK